MSDAATEVRAGRTQIKELENELDSLKKDVSKLERDLAEATVRLEEANADGLVGKDRIVELEQQIAALNDANALLNGQLERGELATEKAVERMEKMELRAVQLEEKGALLFTTLSV